jgi:type I restriction enzyme R subunit
MFQFIKIRTVVLDMKNINAPNDFKEHLEKLTHEIKSLQNHDDEKVINLDEFLKETFKKLQFNDINDIQNLDKDILAALEKAKAINEENAKLSSDFNGNFAYVKTYQDMVRDYPTINKDDAFKFVKTLEEAVTGISSVSTLVLVGRTNFIANVKKQTSGKLLTTGLYSKLDLGERFDTVLGKLFVNLQLY